MISSPETDARTAHEESNEHDGSLDSDGSTDLELSPRATFDDRRRAAGALLLVDCFPIGDAGGQCGGSFSRGVLSELIGKCQEIARKSSVSAIAAAEPGAEEKLDVWRRRP